jgi:hypothetical protein
MIEGASEHMEIFRLTTLGLQPTNPSPRICKNQREDISHAKGKNISTKISRE